MKKAFRKFVKTLTLIIFTLLYRVKIYNRHYIPNQGPALLFANHNAELDMFFIGYRINRWIYWMAKEELFKIPFLGAFVNWLGAFPVKRGKGDVGAIKKVYEHLEKGHIVGIFPQGTRTKGKSLNKIKPRPGAALIAIRSGVPIIPVALKTSYIPFSSIKVVFGKPFSLDLDKHKKYNKEELNEISKNIMKTIYLLLEDR